MLRRIAMSQSPTRLGAAQRAKTTEHFFWRHRKLVYTDTNRIINRINNGGQNGIGAHLAGALATVRAILRGAFQHTNVVRRQIAGARHKVSVEINGSMIARRVIGLGRFPSSVAHAHPGATAQLLLN
jgi:hypothetical protein